MERSVSETRPGALRMVGALLRAPFERLLLSEELARHDRLAIEVANMSLDEAVRRIMPDDDDLEEYMRGASAVRDLDPQTAKELRAAALEASYRNGHCAGYLRMLERFVLGEGPTFSIDDESWSEVQKQAALDWWDVVKDANDWDSMEDELPRRLWREGEIFLREFPHVSDGPQAEWEPSPKAVAELRAQKVSFRLADLTPPSHPAGMTFFRFIPPDHIDDPSGKISHGVLTSGSDAVTVLGYCLAPPNEHGIPKITELIPAREVLHHKIRVDQDVKRGRSILEPVMKRVAQFEKWVDYRLVLNLVRSAIVLHKRIRGGSPSQVTAARDAQATTRETGLNSRRQKMVKAGTVVTTGSGIDYEYLTPNVQAQDAQHDGRMLALSAGVPTGLPEYMWTGDASNSNFASTMVAESPAVREFEDQQDTLRPDYQWVIRRALANGVKYGAPLKAAGITEEMVESVEIGVTFPPMVARDIEKTAKRDEILNRIRAKSVETIATEHGLDYEQERLRIRKEHEDAIDFVLPPLDDDGDDGGEE